MQSITYSATTNKQTWPYFLPKNPDYQISDPSWHVETAPLEVSGFSCDKKYWSQENKSNRHGGRERQTGGIYISLNESFKFFVGEPLTDLWPTLLLPNMIIGKYHLCSLLFITLNHHNLNYICGLPNSLSLLQLIDGELQSVLVVANTNIWPRIFIPPPNFWRGIWNKKMKIIWL